MKARYGITAGIAAASLGIAVMTAAMQPPAPAGLLTAALTQAMVAPVQTAGTAGVAPGRTFVALGDSYAAGNLISSSPAGTPAGCLRSTHNYSGDVQAVIHASRYVDAACSDATTADMTRPQSTVAGTNPPQFNALAPIASQVLAALGR